jgi:outer membrane lipase/esterase
MGTATIVESKVGACSSPHENIAARPVRRLTRLLFGFICLGAPLLADAQAPTVSQILFTPATIGSGATSQLTIVLSNPSGAPVTLTQPLTDSLPPGLTVAAAAAGGSCTAGSIVAQAGGTSVSYGAGAAIPAGNCFIVVTVKGTSASGSTYFTDSIPAGALVTTLGASTTGASGTLTVRAAVAVPNLAGLSQTAAATALQGAGLVLGTVTHGPSTATINTVASQVPAAAVSAPAGSAVNIVLSTGPGAGTNPNAPLSTAPSITKAQVSVAAAVERTCASLGNTGKTPLTVLQQHLLANCTALINTYGGGNNAATVNDALTAVSGRQTTGTQKTGVQFSGTQFTNIGARLAQLRQGVSGASAAGLDLGLPGIGAVGGLLAALQDAGGSGASGSGDGTPVVGGGAGDTDAPHNPLSRFGFFVNGSLRRGTQANTDYETGFDFKSNGVTAGLDYRFTDRLVFGVAVGHSNGSSDFTGQSARLDSRSNSGSLYGMYYNKDLYVDVIGTFGHISYDENRTTGFSIVPGSTGTATPNCVGSVCQIDVSGATGARQFAFGTSTGYSFHQGGFTLGPDVALDYTRVEVNAFTESDPTQSGLALAYGKNSGDSLILKAGGHLSYAISTPVCVILPQVRARYDHEFRDNQSALAAHFAADPTIGSANGPISNFVVFTDVPTRNYFDWAAGLSAQFAYGLSAFVNYSAVADQTNLTSHEYAFGVRYQYRVR